MTLAHLDEYRQEGLDSVGGWFRHQDLKMFEDILATQLDHRVMGHILEIGCYHGKSAIALGYGLRDGERLHVCDLFDLRPEGISEEGLKDYDGLTEFAFRANYATWHNRLPDIYVCSSTELRSRLKGITFRFIHIDGSHAYTAVRKDINTAVETAAPYAVIALDDYRTSHTPGVSAAVWEAVSQGTLFPFALSEVKMYAATSRVSQSWWTAAVMEFEHSWEEHIIGGLKVLRIGEQ